MAVRQYIGARYVPLYVGDWDQTRNYEPLSIVTDANGNSFTSLKDVPAGTLLTDRNYWIQTSSFSGAIDQLQNRVSALESESESLEQDITNLSGSKKTNGRRFVLFGDSFAYGIHRSEPQTDWSSDGWIRAAKKHWGTSNVFAFSAETSTQVTGTNGFASGNGYPWQRQIDDVAATISDDVKLSITDVVVLGGSNDPSRGIETIENGIGEFCRKAAAYFPNAHIKIGLLGTGAIKNAALIAEYKKCVIYKAQYISDTLNLMCDPRFLSDGTHLTDEGYAFYKPYILDAVLKGNCEYKFSFESDITLSEDYTALTPGKISFVVTNQEIEMYLGSLTSWNDKEITLKIVNEKSPIGTLSLVPIVMRNKETTCAGVATYTRSSDGSTSYENRQIEIGLMGNDNLAIVSYNLLQNYPASPAWKRIYMTRAMSGRSKIVQ